MKGEVSTHFYFPHSPLFLRQQKLSTKSFSFIFANSPETSSRFLLFSDDRSQSVTFSGTRWIMKRISVLSFISVFLGVLVVICAAELLPNGFSSSLIMPRRNHGC